MKRFLRNIIFWGLPIFALYGFLILYTAGPTTDYFYNRFTQPKAPSLIAGSSRAAQGIIPTVIDSMLAPTPYTPPLFNYAFTNHESPYGPCYLNALKKKFTGQKGGLFILAVEPFVLSNFKNNFCEEGETFDECDLPPSNMHFVDVKPNIEYFLRNRLGDFGKLAHNSEEQYSTYLHDDGWLQVNFPFDTALIRRNTAEKIDLYVNGYVPKIKSSPARWAALRETIEYFSGFGKVVLIRIPVDPQIERIEREFAPDFDERIQVLARETHTVYMDYHYLNETLFFNDGNHLHKTSSRQFSVILAKDLRRIYGR